MKGPNGAERIAAERRRQFDEERYTRAHDIDHDQGELAVAAACYATNGTRAACVERHDLVRDAWPWDLRYDKRKKHDRIRQLEIAGALIAAEIDRLMLEESVTKTGSGG